MLISSLKRGRAAGLATRLALMGIAFVGGAGNVFGCLGSGSGETTSGDGSSGEPADLTWVIEPLWRGTSCRSTALSADPAALGPCQVPDPSESWCLESTPRVDAQGRVSSCYILEVRSSAGACSCDGAGRIPVAPAHATAADLLLTHGFFNDETRDDSGWDCACEIEQLQRDALEACQSGANDDPAASGGLGNGWCYVDASLGIGDPELVAACQGLPGVFRLVNGGRISPGATPFSVCEFIETR